MVTGVWLILLCEIPDIGNVSVASFEAYWHFELHGWNIIFTANQLISDFSVELVYFHDISKEM